LTMFVLSVLLFVLSVYCDIDPADLCGTWEQSVLLCAPSQGCDCCSTDTIPPPCGGSCSGDPTFNDVQVFEFLSNGSYSSTHEYFTGQCGNGGNTRVLSVTTYGDYTLGDDANATNFTEIKYTPTWFSVIINKNNKVLFYTAGNPGPCVEPWVYWNSTVYGCPCNETILEGDSYPRTVVFPGNLSECNFCEDRFFLDDSVRYGTIKLETNSNNNIKTIQLTNTSLDSDIGYAYGPAEVAFTLEASGECEGVLSSAVPLSLLLLVICNLFLNY